MSLRAIATLAGWLGPWAGTRVPRDVVRTTEMIPKGERTIRAHLYRPTNAPLFGAYLMSPGLHFLGPDDPRFDRFCRVLASAGSIVLAPFLPDYLALQISKDATNDLGIAFDRIEAEARAHALPKPAIFSISFGSQPAIALAARDEFAERVSTLVLFGGFADFDATVRFAIGGGDGMAHDPLNAPVVWLHLLDRLPMKIDRRGVAMAWRTMVERTWGRMELKVEGARNPIAHDIARTLDPPEREVFLMGCGLHDGSRATFERALGAIGDTYAWADPRPHLARVRSPVVIVHGRDDDVIPWFEADKLRSALPPNHPHKVLVTGMYGHTGSAIPDVRALGREAKTMLEVVRALVRAPTGRL